MTAAWVLMCAVAVVIITIGCTALFCHWCDRRAARDELAVARAAGVLVEDRS